MKDKTIDEFLNSSQTYIETLKRCKDETCFVCGMKAESYEKLVHEVRILKMKAIRLDEIDSK
jgi:hypothetical protein